MSKDDVATEKQTQRSAAVSSSAAVVRHAIIGIITNYVQPHTWFGVEHLKVEGLDGVEEAADKILEVMQPLLRD